MVDNVNMWKIRLRRVRDLRRDERGATLVEAAFVYGLLFLTLFAIIEFGLAFKDWLSVSHAARDGARAGATFGNDPTADILVLDGVENTLGPLGLSPGDEVRIFRANNPSPLESQTYVYTPNFDCSNSPPLSGCCDWSPCPEFGRASYTVPGWDPTTRDITAPGTDRIGVEVEFTHNWVTGFFADTTDVTAVTDFQLEPRLFEGP